MIKPSSTDPSLSSSPLSSKTRLTHSPYLYAFVLIFLFLFTTPALSKSRAPGLIVRFQSEGPHALLESAEQLFESRTPFRQRTADASSSIDTLNSQYKVKRIRALFREAGSSSLQEQRSKLSQRLRKGETQNRGTQNTWPDISHIYRIELPDGANTQTAMKSFESDPHIAWVQQDHSNALDGITNDPYLSSTGTWGQSYEDLWALYRIRAIEAWELSQGEGTVVAVVDTGVDYTHPDLADNIWINPGEDLNSNGRVDAEDLNGIDDDGNGFIDDLRGFDFANSFDGDGDGFYDGPLDESDPDPFDDRGHGTHVAGTIAAVGSNGLGIIGVAPKAKIMALKGFPSEGDGLDSDLWRAVLYAAVNGADVINNSWSCRPNCPNNPLAEEVLDIVQSLGVVVVTSAGNAQRDAVVNSPENLRNTITVGASGQDDQRSVSISNFGWVVDLMAPGGGPASDPSVRVARRNILSLRSSGDSSPDFVVDEFYLRLAGTSMASPHVAGVVALLKAQRPELDYETIRRILRQSAADIGNKGHDYDTGAGRLDALAALEMTDPPDMGARITSPQNWALFGQGEEILFTGSATGAELQSWTLEVGAGTNPSQWILIASGTTAITGEMARWSPEDNEQGAYVVRLSANSTQGDTFLEFSQFSVELQTPQRFSSPGQPAQDPDIAYPWIVWSSNRDSDDPFSPAEDRDLFLTNIRNGREISIHRGPGRQEEPSISSYGKRVTLSWNTDQLQATASSELEGCGFHLYRPRCNPFSISRDPSLFPESRAMGPYIVWLETVEDRRKLISCKVNPDGQGCEPSSLGQANPFDVSFPAGTGQSLIWNEVKNGYRFGLCEIDSDTGLCPKVGFAEGSPSLSRPTASGDFVAWVGFTGQTNGPLRICEFNRDTGACPWINVARGVADLRPQLSGNRLVWEDSKNGEASDIFFCEYDSLRGVCPVQRLTGQMGVQTDSRIDDDWIVWEDERNGSSAIYGSALPSFKKARIHRAREERNMRIRIGVKDPMKELLEMSVETASGKTLEELGASFAQIRDRAGYAKGELNWRPHRGQAGLYVFTFSAKRPNGLTVRKSVEVNIEPARSRSSGAQPTP